MKESHYSLQDVLQNILLLSVFIGSILLGVISWLKVSDNDMASIPIPLVISATWNTIDDVDLYIIDPKGKEYSYKNRVYVGSNDELSLDSRHGPGTEIWKSEDVKEGDYQIFYSIYKKRTDINTEVKGWLFFKDKLIALDTKRFEKAQDKVHIATVNVSHKGAFTVQSSLEDKS